MIKSIYIFSHACFKQTNRVKSQNPRNFIKSLHLHVLQTLALVRAASRCRSHLTVPSQCSHSHILSPNMGRKHDAVLVSEPVAEEAPNSPVLESEKKKKKKKRNKDNLQNEEANNSPKRKLVELDLQNDTESEKKNKKNKNKNKHHHKSNENAGETDGNGDETVTDGAVLVTGKNAGDAKYAAVKAFGDSGLPENVLECCKGFDKPSPIQSRAWPFLLDGRDFIGIAATGSGEVWFCVLMCVFWLNLILILVVFREDAGFRNTGGYACSEKAEE